MLSAYGALNGSYDSGRAAVPVEQPPSVDWTTRKNGGGGDGSSPRPQSPPAAAFSAGGAAGVGALLALIVFLSVAGNVLVCIAIAKDRRLRKIGNLFLVSLATADLIVSCLVMPFALVNDLLGYWPFPEWFCNTWVALDVLSATASILHLCAISLDRYVHMKAPFKYEMWITTAKCAALIGLVWFTALLISVVPVNLGWHFSDEHVTAAAAAAANATLVATAAPLLTRVLPSGYYAASANFSAPATTDAAAARDEHFKCSFDVNPTYAIVSSAISFYIPCVVMLSIYGKMYRLARRQVKKIKLTKRTEPLGWAAAAAAGAVAAQEERCAEAAAAGRSPSLSSTRARKSGAAALRENKALFTLGVILGAFLVSWSPFFAVNVVNALWRCVPPELFQAFTWLGYFNSAQNPIIYSIFNVDFRNSFARTLRCRRRSSSSGGGSSSSSRVHRPAGQAAAATPVLGMSDAALQPLLGSGRRVERRVALDVEASVSVSPAPSPSAYV